MRFGIRLPLPRGVYVRLRYRDTDGDLITLACAHARALRAVAPHRTASAACLKTPT